MPKTFAYKVKDRSGTALQGSIMADSETAVVAALRGKGYFITQIKEKRTGIFEQDITLFAPRVTTADLALFARQFSVMIDAGIPLLSVLNVLVEQTDSKLLKETIQTVQQDVQGGETLAQAMAKHPAVFPVIMVSLVEAGELGGVLNEVMERLATHLEKEHKMMQKVKGAMMYPLFIMIIAVLVISGIITFILPTFAEIFINAKIELPAPTRLLLFLSDVFRKHYILLCGAMALIVLGAAKTLSMPRLRPFVDAAKLRLPVWGDISKKVAVARFCRTLATLLHGGVNILPALEVVKRVAGNYVVEETLSRAQASMKEGQGLAPQLAVSGVFPSMVVRMVAIGEETGEIDRMLEKVADFFESEVDDKLNNFSKLIEPLLIVALAVVIGAIVISIMLPMFELSSTIH